MALPRNGYNTPGMNTYATPGGTMASGLGNAGPGSAAMIDRYRQQQSMNSMTPSQRAYVQRFGSQTAAPAAPAQSAPPQLPTAQMREQERMYVPRNQSDGSIGQSRFIEGVPTSYGSTVIRDPRTGGLALFGGQAGQVVGQDPRMINDARIGAGRNENARIKSQLASNTGGYAAAKRYATAQREIMARRAAMQSGRPLREKFGGLAPAPAAQGMAQGTLVLPPNPGSPGEPVPRMTDNYRLYDNNGTELSPFEVAGTAGAPNVRPEYSNTPMGQAARFAQQSLPGYAGNAAFGANPMMWPNLAMQHGLGPAMEWWYGNNRTAPPANFRLNK